MSDPRFRLPRGVRNVRREGGGLTIELSRPDYLKALQHVRPTDRFDPAKRIADMIGRLAARKASKDPAFLDLLARRRMMNAGTRFHRIAENVARQVVDRLGPARRGELTPERTVRSPVDGAHIRVDLFGKLKSLIVDVDWKYNAKSALSRRSRDQAVTHQRVIGDRFNVKPIGNVPRKKGLIHFARNWAEYVRQVQGEAAKLLPAARNKPRPAQGPKNNSDDRPPETPGAKTETKPQRPVPGVKPTPAKPSARPSGPAPKIATKPARNPGPSSGAADPPARPRPASKPPPSNVKPASRQATARQAKPGSNPSSRPAPGPEQKSRPPARSNPARTAATPPASKPQKAEPSLAPKPPEPRTGTRSTPSSTPPGPKSPRQASADRPSKPTGSAPRVLPPAIADAGGKSSAIASPKLPTKA